MKQYVLTLIGVMIQKTGDCVKPYVDMLAIKIEPSLQYYDR